MRDLLRGKLEHIERLKREHVAPPGDTHSEPKIALVIDGKTLGYVLDQNIESEFLSVTEHCNSVLCCRATPFQKVTFIFY